MQQVVLETYGVDLVDGFSEIGARFGVESGKFERQGQTPYASYATSCEAHRLRERPGTYMEWRTFSVPQDLAETVIFMVPMGMGFGSNLPQPTGKFRLFVNSQYTLSFCVSKYTQQWQSVWERDGRSVTVYYFDDIRL